MNLRPLSTPRRTEEDRPHRRHRRDRGQILVILSLALVAIAGMVGLVLDGGSTYAQRRGQQSAADLAAMAAANQYLVTGDLAQSRAKGRAIAAQNGFDTAVAGTTVDVEFEDANQTRLKVDVQAAHRNTFASVMGFAAWPVSVTATVRVGIPRHHDGRRTVHLQRRRVHGSGRAAAAAVQRSE